MEWATQRVASETGFFLSVTGRVLGCVLCANAQQCPAVAWTTVCPSVPLQGLLGASSFWPLGTKLP